MINRYKFFLILLSLLFVATGCSQYKVYSVKDNPALPVGGGIVYALPKTQLCISVTVQRRDLSKAPYCSFAADYLGINPTDIDTSFQLLNIEVEGVNVADPDNYYYIHVNRGTVTVDNRHLLLAIGTDISEATSAITSMPSNNMAQPHISASYNLYDRVDTFYTRYDSPENPSMLSTRKDVRSVKQRAAAAAERLDEIQSKQQELIDGDYEGSYSAEAVQYLYAQLKRQEAQIIASFCGESKQETVRFYLEPQLRRNSDLCDTLIWFSPTTGFAGDEEHLPSDAFPIICCVHNNNDLKSANRFVKYHTSGYTSNSNSGHTGTAAAKTRSRKGFRYRIPVTTTVEVSSPVFSVSRQVPLSQLGPVVELPRRRIKATFDHNTLDLKKLDRR